MADASFKKVIRGKLKLKRPKGSTKSQFGAQKRERDTVGPSSSHLSTGDARKAARREDTSAEKASATDGSVQEDVVAVLHYEDEADLKEKRLAAEDQAFHTYSSEGGKVMRYRVKSKTAIGSYKVVQQEISAPMSRSELLNKRSKHKSDRMCM